MSVFFRRRGEPPATMIAVTITGAGSASKCYAIINGTKQYSAGTYEVNSGDTITFGVFGISPRDPGTVIIDGTEVLRVTNNSTKTYDWTVPDGIQTIAIDMSEISNPMVGTVCAEITVTTS